MQGEKSKRESSPWLKRKRKSPGLKNRTIQSRKQRKFGSLLVSTLLDVFFLSFSALPLCCRISRARLRFSHYQSGQSAIRYNKSWLIMQCWMPFPANSKLFLSQTLFREPYVDFHWSAASYRHDRIHTRMRELKQQRRQRQRKRYLKTNIWEMVTILLLLLLRRIPYFWQSTREMDW